MAHQFFITAKQTAPKLSDLKQYQAFWAGKNLILFLLVEHGLTDIVPAPGQENLQWPFSRIWSLMLAGSLTGHSLWSLSV